MKAGKSRGVKNKLKNPNLVADRIKIGNSGAEKINQKYGFYVAGGRKGRHYTGHRSRR